MTPNPSTLTPADLADLDVSELHDLGLWPPKKEFLVYYSLCGAMPTDAQTADEAVEAVFGRLHALVGRVGTAGLTAEEAGRVGLSKAEVAISLVETIQPAGDGP